MPSLRIFGIPRVGIMDTPASLKTRGSNFNFHIVQDVIHSPLDLCSQEITSVKKYNSQ